MVVEGLEFPRMLYRAPGPVALESGMYECRVVADEAEARALASEGWRLDQYAAKAAHEAQAPRAVIEGQSTGAGDGEEEGQGGRRQEVLTPKVDAGKPASASSRRKAAAAA